MHGQKISQISWLALAVLATVALLAVLSGYFRPPQRDEGAAAHVFQLSIVLLLPTMGVFLATADWTKPLRIARRLLFPGGAVVLAFGALYYLEHFR
jgi:ABC-type amino acid transport system permease subunit